MASTGVKDASIACSERTLINAIAKYDVKRLLGAAAASNHGVITEEERKEIVERGQISQKVLCEKFEALIVENGRVQNFARFILEYNRRIQNAALAVLYPTGRIHPPASSSVPSSTISPSNTSQESCSSRTPPSPMDIDAKENVYSQVTNDADTVSMAVAEQTQDDGYHSLSKGLSQELARLSLTSCNSHGQSPGFQPTDEKKLTLAAANKTTYRKRKKRAKQRADESVMRQNTHIPLITAVMSHDVEHDTCHNRTFQSEKIRESRLGNHYKCLWPPAHFEVILQTLNMDALLLHLYGNKLLTNDELEMIESLKGTPRKQNRHFLLCHEREKLHTRGF